MSVEIECKEFKPHPIRKLCVACQKTKRHHPLFEEDAENIKKHIKAFAGQPETKPNSQYAWIPPQCPENRIDDYFQKFPGNEVPRHNSEGQHKRLQRLVNQVPLSDLSLDNCRFADPETKADMENFIQNLQESILRLGFVKEWESSMSAQCPRCFLILDPGELVVLSVESGGPAFHPVCFTCLQCSEPLADLVHCADVDGAVSCVRHHGEGARKRCHACDELIFSSRYALAGEKFYHRDHLLCFSCDKPLEDSRGYDKEGELHCAPCYEQKFCKDCLRCGKRISLDRRHVTFKDDNWHYECFACNTCNSLLADCPFEIVSGNFYCTECYKKDFAPKCAECLEIFEPQAKVVKYEDKIYHVPCFKCADCKETIGTGSFVPQKDRVYCKECYLRDFGVRCFRCKAAITDERGIMYNKEPYHEDCFACHKCSVKIADKPFRTVSDNWYCMSCYGDTFCKKCHACNKPILLGADDDMLFSFDNYRWHANCFNCSACKRSLADTPFMMRDKVLVCRNCLRDEGIGSKDEMTAYREKGVS